MFGALLGAPTLKLRGDYLAIVTLGFGEIIRIFMNNLNAPVNITNGPQGINLIDPIRIFGVSLAGEPGSQRHACDLRLVHDALGERLLLPVPVAVHGDHLHHDPPAAFASGPRLGRDPRGRDRGQGDGHQHPQRQAAGVLRWAPRSAASPAPCSPSFQGFVSPESFSLTESIAVLAMVVLGGIGHIPGVILGGVLLAALPEVLRHTVEPVQMALFGKVLIDAEVLRQLLYGLAMVVIMLYRPAGLWPSPERENRPIDKPAKATGVVTA